MLDLEGAPVPRDAMSSPSLIVLPPVPEQFRTDAVAAWQEPLVIDSYLPIDPPDFPAFLDSRVYQGSSGRVYPLPFHERIAPEKTPRAWTAVHLENQWIRLVVLPELGGRIHVGYDKTADYDFFYRNNVIKPALVGLAGPWISGGVEFNWPQHHRPATFLPTDWEIEREGDGAVTVWCSDHDPMNRMKGMHGIRIRPDSSLIEARVRLYNRTDETQTFLWWANVAAPVNDDYQSFFPVDVHHVADHAKRAVATFPHVEGHYYGVDYPSQITAERPDGDRLDWYRNIPVPTSYMITDTGYNFFGGYDHGRNAGFVHWADRTIAPGKKQWTWGNAEFGKAWDENLTDGDGPYVELMAGAYTDNQPDFSWIAPGETKTFSQFWYPITQIGPAQQANTDVAVRMEMIDQTVRIGVAASRVFAGATVSLGSEHRVTVDVGPGAPYLATFAVTGSPELLIEHEGRTLMRWAMSPPADAVEPAIAAEPPEPAKIDSPDELYLTGQYLEQYRHATRRPEPYWQEALRRDPGDSRSHVALARRLAESGLFGRAEQHLRSAIARLTARVPNPANSEAHYRLGIVLTHLGRMDDAVDSLGKALWNYSWRVPAGFALARIHAADGRYTESEQAIREVLRLDSQHSQARALLTLVLRSTGRSTEAATVLDALLADDPLDQWARDIARLRMTVDAPTLLDVAIEYATTGFCDDALRVLEMTVDAAMNTPVGQVQVAPLAYYHAAAIHERAGHAAAAAAARAAARATDLSHCLPSRLADVEALESAGPEDPTASLLLGSWYYDRGRYPDAVRAWTRATDSPHPHRLAMAHRNLGIAAYNWARDGAAAIEHFTRARQAAPAEAKLLFEYDQLAARIGGTDRLAVLEAEEALVAERDDLTIAFALLLAAAGRPARARDVMTARRFQPWEGGEGVVLEAWDAAMTGLSAQSSTAQEALGWIEAALTPPTSLGEARHPLANSAELHLLLGDARARLGDAAGARRAWRTAAEFTGDFRNGTATPFGPQTVFSIRALRALDEEATADALTLRFTAYIDELASTPARVDYFATSLPATLLFHEDPQDVRDRDVARLRRQLRDVDPDPMARSESAAESVGQ